MQVAPAAEAVSLSSYPAGEAAAPGWQPFVSAGRLGHRAGSSWGLAFMFSPGARKQDKVSSNNERG